MIRKEELTSADDERMQCPQQECIKAHRDQIMVDSLTPLSEYLTTTRNSIFDII